MSATTRMTSSFAGLSDNMQDQVYGGTGPAHKPGRRLGRPRQSACGTFQASNGARIGLRSRPQRKPMRLIGQIRMNTRPTMSDLEIGPEEPAVLGIPAVVPHHEVVIGGNPATSARPEGSRVSRCSCRS